MPGTALERTPQYLLIGAAVLTLAACSGGGTSIGGVSGSSSGGSDSSILSGTFTGQTGTSERVIEGVTTPDTPVFGAIDGQGNGFLADMSAASGGNQAVFRLNPASQPSADTLSGTYYAYYTGGSNNSVVLGGSLGGTYTASGASLNFGPIGGGTSNGPSDTATLVLDSPALTQASFTTIASGTYTATVGSSSRPAITTSSNQADIYTVTVAAGGTIAIGDSSNCNFTGTLTAVSTLDIYDVSATGTCPSTNGSSAPTISLTGLAVYLPSGSKSPLGTGALSAPALLLELDNSQANSNGNYAFALMAVQ